MTKHYGLIGYPLTHSFSPAYFANKFREEGIDAAYEKFEIKEIAAFPELIKARPEIKGLNVTIPYKQSVILFLDELSEEAKAIGAVNCISFTNGKLKGHNTDVIGFEKSFVPLLRPQHRKALVLGTGGSSLAVRYVLDRLNIPYQLVSRTKSPTAITYEELNEAILKEYLILINTTPVGMFPDVENCPRLPYAAISSEHLMYDLIYNPAETKFLALGKMQGAYIKNGWEMLQLQADASWQRWNAR
jgi:shikimate dehydrogenase